MSSTKDSVLEASISALKVQTRSGSGPHLEAFKKFRKINEHRLRIAHNSGGGGRELVRRRSDLTDVIFRELFDQAGRSLEQEANASKVAVVAFGGYGRREMNPFSDVDILFLTRSQDPDAAWGEVIRQTTTALWDLGFKVGHSVRSIADSVRHANEDLTTKTSLMECRYLVGEKSLFQEFRKKFEDACIRGKEREFITWRLENQRNLHAGNGGSVFMQEPNVKSGCGGLRDCHNLLWLAYASSRAQSFSRLVELGILREQERRTLDRAYDFLLRVRTQMHYLNKRPTDLLTLQMQGRIATAFDYPQKSILRRCEAFMRDFYSNARSIHLVTDTAIGRMFADLPRKKVRLLGIFGGKSKEERFDGFLVRDGKLYPESRDIFSQDPGRLMRAFQHAQVRRLELSGELRDLIRRALRLVDRTFQYSRANREIFLSILSRKGEVGPILREMHNTEFLGRYLPEFGALTCLVQHEFFHRYTADEHTLVCIEKLDAVLFSQREDLKGYRQMFQRLVDSAVLYLALLLHDTGKSANRRNHEEASAELARKVARRLQLPPDKRRALITLVDSHYALSKTSRSRNLDDPFTITEFASVVKSREVLDALMLLTLADGMGTSDVNWSDWKEGLVWQLYGQTAEYLATGPSFFELKKKERLELKRMALSKLPKDFEEEAVAHFENMPERYFHAFDADAIREHLRLFRNFFREMSCSQKSFLKPAIEWIGRDQQGHSEVRICGWDRPKLFERIAGAFVAANINILSADVFTRSDHLVLDVFRVCDLQRRPVERQKDKNLFQQRLEQSLAVEQFDFRPFFQKSTGLKFYRLSQDFDLPTRVVVENSLHPQYTLVEIQTPDRPGLLYDLLGAFNELEISIELSRITTEMDVAIDAFYVTTRDGKKLEDPKTILELQKLLHRSATRISTS